MRIKQKSLWYQQKTPELSIQVQVSPLQEWQAYTFLYTPRGNLPRSSYLRSSSVDKMIRRLNSIFIFLHIKTKDIDSLQSNKTSLCLIAPLLIQITLQGITPLLLRSFSLLP